MAYLQGQSSYTAGSQKYDIRLFANNFPIFYRMILDLYGPYDALLQHTYFFPIFIENSHQMIVFFTPSL